MKGDFSRGIQPDTKRGRRYRRVLLQQGRVLLDSDQVATVDALQREDRDIVRHVTCAHGSSDAGFLCSSGRLLALFDTTDGVERVSGDALLSIDFRHRYLGRQPALSITARGAAAATVSVRLRAAVDDLVVWARAEQATTVRIGGIAVTLAADSPPTEFQKVRINRALAQDQVTVEVPAGATAWLALIEAEVPFSDGPSFHSAQGSYQVDGLTVSLPADKPFPESGFPSEAGFQHSASPPASLPGIYPEGLAVGQRVVAYVEAWERHLTHIEDPGIRERALGGSDTTTRTEALGQVKLARISGFTGSVPAIADAIKGAFARTPPAGGTLAFTQQPANLTDDPCALPEQEGYSGVDNRLYRIEVHEGGAFSSVRCKWSRNNAAELFEPRLDTGFRLLVPKNAPLAGNDLVEVLSEVIDLGDAQVGRVEPAGFTPAERSVGVLARLKEEEAVLSNDRVFTLVDPDDSSVTLVMETEVLPRLGDLTRSRLRLRRWDGILDPQAAAGTNPPSPGPHDVEDGLQVTFSSTGTYQPGQYWQYEARVGGENHNGEASLDPHGPERLFAPLALFEFDGTDQPLELLAWLDERYPRLCELRADDVAYQGERAGSPSRTVQEALDEIFTRGPEIIEAGCGAIIVRPENNLQAVFDSIPNGANAKICIHPGQWNVTAPVLVENKGHLIIEGAGRATTITRTNGVQALCFKGCTSVTMSGLNVRSYQQPSGGTTLFIQNSETVDLRDVEVVGGRGTTSATTAVCVMGGAAGINRSVRVRDCRITVTHAQIGLVVTHPQSVEVRGNEIRTIVEPLNWAQLINQDSVVAPWFGHVIADNFTFGETEEANSNDQVGSPELVHNGANGHDGRPRIYFWLDSWGSEFVTFSTQNNLASTAFWETILRANPIDRPPLGTQVPYNWILANFRRLRKNMARFMFLGPGSAPINVPAAAAATLNSFANFWTQRSSVSSGAQGIVVGTRRAANLAAPPPVIQSPREPEVRIIDNRVLGFTQGIHVGTSDNTDPNQGRRILYRVHLERNTVQLHIPPMVRERHGLFVGNALSTQILNNFIEQVVPEPINPIGQATDGIRVWGWLGPMLQVRDNHLVGMALGVRGHATNPSSNTFTQVRDNVYYGPGQLQRLTQGALP